MKKVLSLFIALFALSAIGYSQGALVPKASPLDLATTFVKDTYIKVVYSRPHKRDREIFGELVPYGEVWRTGANAATEITFTHDVIISDVLIPAGTYSLYTIPHEDFWTIILNTDVGQWGSYRYNMDNDLLRFRVNVNETDVVWEPFTIMFESNARSTQLKIVWDETLVEFAIRQAH